MHTNDSKKINTYFFWMLFSVLVFASFVVWQSIIVKENNGKLIVTFLDVGQGDSVFIETPSGNQVLIDGGKGRAVLRGLGKAMPFYDRSIDVVVATHPDLDHIGGLPEVFKRYDIDMFIEPGVFDDGADNVALQNAVQKEGIQTLYARGGMKIMIDEDVELHILFPDRDAKNLEANTGSIVARLVYKERSFLFTGDSPAGIETYLVSLYGDALGSDVLKLGHHGSRTSTSDVFLGFVDPEYAVISVGCNNSYGHPHKEILEKLERFEINKLSTCEEGRIIFESDGLNMNVK